MAEGLPQHQLSPAQVRRYIRRVQSLLDKGTALTNTSVKESFELINRARREILDALAKAPKDGNTYAAYQLQNLLASVDAAAATFQRDFAHVLGSGANTAFNLGTTITVDSLAGIGVSLGVTPDFSRSQLIVAAQMFPDMVQRVGNVFKERVKREIQLGVLGVKPIGEIQDAIVALLQTQPRRKDKQLGTIAYQAERIVRTEMNGAFAIGNEMRQQQVAGIVPGLKKVWLTAHDGRVRLSHALAGSRYASSGNPGPIPFEQDYMVGGERAKFPHDPRLSAGNKIHCRCTSLLWSDTWFGPSSGTNARKLGVLESIPVDKQPKNLRDMQGGVNQVFRGELEGNDVVIKPEALLESQQMRNTIKPGDDLGRERAAYLIAKRMGVDAPETVIREVEEIVGKRAIMQTFVKSDGTLLENLHSASIAMNDIDPESLRSMALFDAVIGNTDRHWGNALLVGKKLVPIDHGLAFPEGANLGGRGNFKALDLFQAPFGPKELLKLSDSETELLKSLLASRAAIRSELEPLLPTASVRGMLERVEEMLDTGELWDRMKGVA